MSDSGENYVVPMDELTFRFSRSSGPGGQHVNRSATQVELLFDVARSPSLTDEQRALVMRRLRGYIDGDGVLHLVSSGTRSQLRNREEVVRRFAQIMERALRVPKPRRATRPSAAARERRLAEKRRRAEIKRLRSRANDE
ncbi:MAG: alternative ribosome rescue aminoacyl-tRNA hydrolase ArfB [Anaerolineae bacterium]|nr:alternative ribosome rescue aminoacyl-tRNA hydrolase ArfB [Anaerolineae bacterium]